MDWRTIIVAVVTLLIGAYIGSKWPQFNVIAKVAP